MNWSAIGVAVFAVILLALLVSGNREMKDAVEAARKRAEEDD